MDIKLNSTIDSESYTAHVETYQEFFELLRDNNLLKDATNFEVPKAFDWFDKLQQGCIVTSAKDLNCTIQPHVVEMKKIKFALEYIYEDRNLREERKYPLNFSSEKIEADFKEWCNAAIESEWIEVQDSQ